MFCSPSFKSFSVLVNKIVLLRYSYFGTESQSKVTLERFSSFFFFLSSCKWYCSLNLKRGKRGTKLIIMQLCCITAPLNSFYLGCDLNEPTVFSRFSAQDNQALRKSRRDARQRRDGDLQGCVTRAGRPSNLGLRGAFFRKELCSHGQKELDGEVTGKEALLKIQGEKKPASGVTTNGNSACCTHRK